MHLNRTYVGLKFHGKTLKEGAAFISGIAKKAEKPDIPHHRSLSLSARIGNDSWDHDTEAEFYADYKKAVDYARYRLSIEYGDYVLQLVCYRSKTDVEVSAPTRALVEEGISIFDEAVQSSDVEELDNRVEPVIFIGHGQGSEWRDLKDHLADKQHYTISAYEVGARAGHAIRDVLDDMSEESTFAILVMSGDDKTDGGELRARQNVIHEIGLFQGRLGYARAIVLIEKGVEVPSNINGITWISYERGHINGTFGDIIATVNREFYS
jgi:hypothetical protein